MLCLENWIDTAQSLVNMNHASSYLTPAVEHQCLIDLWDIGSTLIRVDQIGCQLRLLLFAGSL